MVFLATQENVILLEGGPQTAPVGSHRLGRPLLEDGGCGTHLLASAGGHACVRACLFISLRNGQHEGTKLWDQRFHLIFAVI